jgi:hypothetical protein
MCDYTRAFTDKAIGPHFFFHANDGDKELTDRTLDW